MREFDVDHVFWRGAIASIFVFIASSWLHKVILDSTLVHLHEFLFSYWDL